MELWKDIEGWPGYSVSNLGNIKGIYGRNLSPVIVGPLNHQYYYVKLCKEGRQISKCIHRRVAVAFIPNPENKPQVDHLNGNKLDNRVENLRWATQSENMLNPNFPAKPNATGHRYITVDKRYPNSGFKVQIQRQSGRYHETFKTLAEAITARDKFISTI